MDDDYWDMDQMKTLALAFVSAILLATIPVSGEDPQPPVSIIFDDALESVYSKACPIMAPYVGSLAVITGWIGVAQTTMTWDQISELMYDGWGVLSHSVDHLRFDTLTESERFHQLRESKHQISENLDGYEAEGFVFPMGVWNQSNLLEALTVYDYVPTKRYSIEGSDWIAWIEAISGAFSKGEGMVLVAHGLGNETECQDMPYLTGETAFREFVNWLKAEGIELSLPMESEIPETDQVCSTVLWIFILMVVLVFIMMDRS